MTINAKWRYSSLLLLLVSWTTIYANSSAIKHSPSNVSPANISNVPTARLLNRPARTMARNLQIAVELPSSGEERGATDFAIYVYPQNTPLAQRSDAKFRADDLFVWQAGTLIFLDVRTLPEREFSGDYGVTVEITTGKTKRSLVAEGQLTYLPEKTDVVLLVDVSLSMRKTDPDQKRHHAVRAFANLAARDGRIGRLGIIAFNENTQVLLNLTELKNTDAIAAAIKQIGNRGQTNLGKALTRASEMLADSDRAAVIMLTDGKNESVPYTNEHRQLARQKIPVYTVGLSAMCDREMLNRIAHTTQGKSFWTANNQELIAIYLALATEIGERATLLRQNFPTNAPQKLSLAVDETINELCVLFANPNATWKITPPQKIADTRDYSNIDFREQRFRQPPAGLWEIEIVGAGELTVTADTGFFLDVFPPVETPAGWVIAATLADGGKAVLQSSLHVSGVDGTPLIELFDDGEHHDGGANDGIYANLITTPPADEIKLCAADATREIYQREVRTQIVAAMAEKFIAAAPPKISAPRITAPPPIAEPAPEPTPYPEPEPTPEPAPCLTLAQTEFDCGVQTAGNEFMLNVKLSLTTAQPLPLTVRVDNDALLFNTPPKKIPALQEKNLQLKFKTRANLDADNYAVPVQLQIGELSAPLLVKFQIPSNAQTAMMVVHEWSALPRGEKFSAALPAHEFLPLIPTREIVALVYAHELRLTFPTPEVSRAPYITPPSKYTELLRFLAVIGGIATLLIIRRLVQTRWVRFALLSATINLALIGLWVSYFLVAPTPPPLTGTTRTQLTAALVNAPAGAPSEFTAATLAIEDKVLASGAPPATSAKITPPRKLSVEENLPEITPSTSPRPEVVHEVKRAEIDLPQATLTELVRQTAPTTTRARELPSRALSLMTAPPPTLPLPDEMPSLTLNNKNAAELKNTAPESALPPAPLTATPPKPEKTTKTPPVAFDLPEIAATPEVLPTLRTLSPSTADFFNPPQLNVNAENLMAKKNTRARAADLPLTNAPLLPPNTEIPDALPPPTENITAMSVPLTSVTIAPRVLEAQLALTAAAENKLPLRDVKKPLNFTPNENANLRFTAIETRHNAPLTAPLTAPQNTRATPQFADLLPSAPLAISLPTLPTPASPTMAPTREKTSAAIISSPKILTAFTIAENTAASAPILRNDDAEFLIREQLPRGEITPEKPVLSRWGKNHNAVALPDNFIHLAKVNFALGLVGVAAKQNQVRQFLAAQGMQAASVALMENELKNCNAVMLAEKNAFNHWETQQLRQYLECGGKLWLHNCTAIPAEFSRFDNVVITNSDDERETLIADILNRFAEIELFPPTARTSMNRATSDVARLTMWQNFSGIAANNLHWQMEKWSNPVQLGITPNGDGGEALQIKMRGGNATRTAISYVVPDHLGRRLSLANVKAQYADIYNATARDLALSLGITTQTPTGWNEFETRAQTLRPGWNRNLIIPLNQLKSRTLAEFNQPLGGAENCAKITYYFHTAAAGDILLTNLRWEEN